MTVNRIGRKNFLTKLGSRKVDIHQSMQVKSSKKKPSSFSAILLKWDKEKNFRQMPWKGEKDAYKIWLSEIILQQTRVDQGAKYYEKFINVFPDIHHLASAPQQKVYKCWEGLGYYTRCKNLIATAELVSKKLKGSFPNTYEEIKKLKGIGPYTAAAIASFAFNEKCAVVDGNVFRVLARIFGIDTPIDSTEGKKFFTHLAHELLDKKNPAIYNQAIMDFGAVVCKPVPLCDQCPFSKTCVAFLHDKMSSLPVKAKKNKVKKRWFNYLLLEYQGHLAIRQRTEKDIWHNLFEFLLVESNAGLDEAAILKEAKKKKWIAKNGFKVKHISPASRQQLSHQLIEGSFTSLLLHEKPVLSNDVFWIPKTEIHQYPFPKFINQHLQKMNV